MRGRRAAAAVLAAGLVLAACSGGEDVAAARRPVEVFGAFTGAEALAFEASVADFERESGIDVRYVPSPDFTAAVLTRAAGPTPPDIAVFPQPGLLGDLADGGALTPLDDVLDLPALRATLVPGLVEAAARADGRTYGAPIRVAAKSLLWTSRAAFAEAGYAVPRTGADLTALTDRIRADGTTPWCLGMENGPATGWVGTDWVEEYVLRVGGPEFYARWARHEVPFNDPVVVRAAQEFERLVLADGAVLGGRGATARTPFRTSANPMFGTPPQCYLHRQGNFLTTPGYFPAFVAADLDAAVEVSPLPAVEGAPVAGQPMLLGGDWAALLDGPADDADTARVLEFLTSDRFGGPWAFAGGWLSPHETFDAAQYPDATTRAISELIGRAEYTGVDGSDQMPGEVGSGSFWRGMVAWITGEQDLITVLNGIEMNWPRG